MHLERRPVIVVGVVAVVMHLAIRIWLGVTGNFYWDDLILIGRASTHPLWSWGFLANDHDGHLMPGAFAAAWICTHLAPLRWALPAITLVVGQLLASIAVVRMVTILAGRFGYAALCGLVFYLFTPMAIPAFAWWSAGLNSVPLQAGLAWVIGDTVLVARGRRAVTPLFVVRCAGVLLLALAFFEKSLLIVPTAIAMAVVAAPDIRTAVYRSARLWLPLIVIDIGWLVTYLVVAGPSFGGHSLHQTATLFWRICTQGIVASLVGGPWHWTRWNPSPPIGFADTWMLICGWLIVVAAVIVALTRRRGVRVLLAVLSYVVLSQIPLLWSRSGPDTAPELAQTMRYLADVAVVCAAAITMVGSAERTMVGSAERISRRCSTAMSGRENILRPLLPKYIVGQATSTIPDTGPIPDTGTITDMGRRRPMAARWRPRGAAGALCGLMLVVSAVISTVYFSRSWHDNPTRTYLQNARKSLADTSSEVMLDQSLPLEILLPVTYPDNQISRVFAAVDPRPAIGDHTDHLRVLDATGRIGPGAVTDIRHFAAGVGSCARPEVSSPTALWLDGPLVAWPWTVELPYCASRDGVMSLSFIGSTADSASAAVAVPVRAGLHRIWVRLVGGGGAIDVRPITPGLRIHLGAGRVGEVVQSLSRVGG